MASYLTFQDISELIDVPVATLYVWRQRGQLPEPDYNPNQRVVLWKPETINEWAKRKGHNDDRPPRA